MEGEENTTISYVDTQEISFLCFDKGNNRQTIKGSHEQVENLLVLVFLDDLGIKIEMLRHQPGFVVSSQQMNSFPKTQFHGEQIQHHLAAKRSSVDVIPKK